jgi:hypothetical protein
MKPTEVTLVTLATPPASTNCAPETKPKSPWNEPLMTAPLAMPKTSCSPKTVALISVEALWTIFRGAWNGWSSVSGLSTFFREYGYAYIARLKVIKVARITKTSIITPAIMAVAPTLPALMLFPNSTISVRRVAPRYTKKTPAIVNDRDANKLTTNAKNTTIRPVLIREAEPGVNNSWNIGWISAAIFLPAREIIDGFGRVCNL